MKHKRSTSRFLALMICLTMVLTPLAAYAAEAEAADQQNAAQITESVEADNAQSLTDSEEASVDDAVIDEDADGDIAAEPESYEDEGGEEADPQGGEDAAPADAGDAEDIDVIDDTNAGEAADAGNTDYEISDPDLDPEDLQPADDPNEIIDDIVEVPSVEIPALADVYDATSPTMVWVESLDPTKIPMPIFGFKQSNEDIYQLYLPGGMNLSDAVLCWDGGSQVTINGEN